MFPISIWPSSGIRRFSEGLPSTTPRVVVVFAIGDVMLNLAPEEGTAPTREPQAVADWTVDDIDAAHRQLLEVGATARGEIITTAVKSRAATLVDPFGNTFGITGKPSTAKQSLDDQPSQSALGTTLFRAFATRDARPEIRGPDKLAEKSSRRNSATWWTTQPLASG